MSAASVSDLNKSSISSYISNKPSISLNELSIDFDPAVEDVRRAEQQMLTDLSNFSSPPTDAQLGALCEDIEHLKSACAAANKSPLKIDQDAAQYAMEDFLVSFGSFTLVQAADAYNPADPKGSIGEMRATFTALLGSGGALATLVSNLESLIQNPYSPPPPPK